MVTLNAMEAVLKRLWSMPNGQWKRNLRVVEIIHILSWDV